MPIKNCKSQAATAHHPTALLFIMLGLLSGCGGGGSNNSTATLAAVDDGPLTTAEGSTLSVPQSSGVLTNDTTTGSAPLSAVLVAGPANASTFTLNQDGSFDYTHNGSETTSDIFTYRASDGTNTSNTATVTITISPVNDPPSALDDSYSGVNEGGTLTRNAVIGVLTNDTDTENDPLSAILVSGPANASAFTLNPDGSFSYTHNGSETISDSFTYRANDGTSDSNTATVTISITPVNNLPVAVNDSYSGASEGTTFTVNALTGVLANDLDSESDPLTAVLVAGPANASAFTLSPDGSFSYTHDGSETTSDSFTYRANDGTGDSNTATVTITVTPVNDPPLAVDDSGLANENTAVILNVLNNDSDIDSTIDSATVVISSQPTNGTAVANADGTVTYTPDTGFTGPNTDTFQYTVDDDGGQTSNLATVTVTINAPPTPVATCSTTPQDTALNGTLTATDVETPSNMLTYSLISNGAKGSVNLNSDGTYTYTPNSTGSRGTDSFDFRVEDLDGGFSIGTETVIVDQKIMPLGDSITRGTMDALTPPIELRVGYRKPLYDSLVASGYSFDFVGSDSLTGNDPSLQPFDSDNEGHGGWRDDEIAWGQVGYPTDGIRAWLDANPTDIILLHIGTNGLDTSAADVESILNEIDLWENSVAGNPVTVILARIINQNPITSVVTTFNDNVVAMALDRVNNSNNPAYPDDIIIVDQEGALTYPDDLFNQEHPNSTGYGKMAPVWEQTLTAGILQKCP